MFTFWDKVSYLNNTAWAEGYFFLYFKDKIVNLLIKQSVYSLIIAALSQCVHIVCPDLCRLFIFTVFNQNVKNKSKILHLIKPLCILLFIFNQAFQKIKLVELLTGKISNTVQFILQNTTCLYVQVMTADTLILPNRFYSVLFSLFVTYFHVTTK